VTPAEEKRIHDDLLAAFRRRNTTTIGGGVRLVREAFADQRP